MSGVVVVNQVGSELFDGYGQSVAKQDGYTISSINSGYLVMGKDSQDLARFIKVGSDGALSVNFSASSIQTDLIKVGGTTVATGNGNSGPGVQRVAISADNTAFSVNAAQSGTWTVQPGNTANTTPWLSTISQGGNSAIVSAGGALKVDGSAVTQPISGTITANIGTSGFLALDATLAKLTIAQGAATGTNTQALAGAIATTAAPTYTTATINPLSLTTAGALRVDGSAVTQPVSGTVSITANSAINLAQIAGVATSTGNGIAGTGVQRVTIASDNAAFSVNAVQSGTWTVQPGNTANTTAWLVNDSSNGTVIPGTAATKSSLIGAQFNTTLPTLTTGQQAALQADSSGRLLIGALATGSNTIGAVTQSGTWTVQPGNTANTTAWLVNDSSNGTVSPGTAATKSSLSGGIYNSSLPTLTTGQQVANQVDSNGRLLIGSLPSGTNTIGSVDGSGSAGVPATGVLTVQGITGGVDLPVSGSVSLQEKATFTASAVSVGVSNNRSMTSIVNSGVSSVVIKIHEIYLINTRNTAITGTVINFELRRIGSHTGGVVVTPIPIDSIDSLAATVTCLSNAVVGSETDLLWRNVWSSDDWQTGTTDVESFDHVMQTLFPIYARKTNGTKPITLRAGDGISVKCATNTTSGTFDILVVFTQE